MEFIRDCARRLDEGERGERVLADLRARYTTPQCLNVKTSLVRSLCAPSKEYSRALDELTAQLEPDLAERVRRVAASGRSSGCPEVQAQLRRLPPRLSPNARACRVTRAEKLECKRSAATSTLSKNRIRHRAPGRELLCSARAVVRSPEGASVPTLALALMLLTGRRTCEVLNGSSQIRPLDGAEHAVVFGGQAKKREGGDTTPMTVPTLAPAARVCAAFERLREKQNGVVRDNRSTSARYQSELGRHLKRAWPWSAVDHVHALRGLYACMALRLFEWGEASDAYVAMQLLGHARLQESLAYTPYDLGPDFAGEPSLGVGRL